MRRIITFVLLLAIVTLSVSIDGGSNKANAECVSCEADLSSKCTYHVSSGNASSIHDGTTRSRWEPKGGSGEASVKLPDSGAVCFELQWTYAPTDFTITQYDAEKNVIATRTREDDDWAYLTQLYDLDPNTRYLSVAFKQKNQGIAELRIYGEGTLPTTVKHWEKPLDKCDLLVLSTHYDDEWLWFGAIIPYYANVQKKNVQVVYMANCGRRRAQEALNGLAVAGTSVYPEFVRLKDEKIKSYEQSLKDWGGEKKLIGVMVEFIRRYKPEVILTHDWNGEYGHNQHKLTSHHIGKAILAAADPEQYPESYEKYGAWQTKKLYSHLWNEQVIQFDWHKQYDEFGGLSGIELATKCMNEHKSQLGAYQVSDGGKYDNSLFGLAYSTVGDDVEHNDLFENITEETIVQATVTDQATLEMPVSEEIAAENISLATPETMIQTENTETQSEAESLETRQTEPDETDVLSESAEETTAEETPVAENSAVIAEENPPEHKTSGSGLFIGMAVGVCAIGVAAFVIYTGRKKRKRRHKRKRHVGASHGNAGRRNGAGHANGADRRSGRNGQRL